MKFLNDLMCQIQQLDKEFEQTHPKLYDFAVGVGVLIFIGLIWFIFSILG